MAQAGEDLDDDNAQFHEGLLRYPSSTMILSHLVEHSNNLFDAALFAEAIDCDAENVPEKMIKLWVSKGPSVDLPNWHDFIGVAAETGRSWKEKY